MVLHQQYTIVIHIYLTRTNMYDIYNFFITRRPQITPIYQYSNVMERKTQLYLMYGEQEHQK